MRTHVLKVNDTENTITAIAKSPQEAKEKAENAIGKSVTYKGISTKYKDDATGARVELCVQPEMLVSNSDEGPTVAERIANRFLNGFIDMIDNDFKYPVTIRSFHYEK